MDVVERKRRREGGEEKKQKDLSSQGGLQSFSERQRNAASSCPGWLLMQLLQPRWLLDGWERAAEVLYWWRRWWQWRFDPAEGTEDPISRA